MPNYIDKPGFVPRQGFPRVIGLRSTPDQGVRRRIETWKGIAVALQRSERWCRYMARRDSDPLPVFKIGGIVCLGHDDLEHWLARQRDKAIRRPGPDMIDAMPHCH